MTSCRKVETARQRCVSTTVCVRVCAQQRKKSVSVLTSAVKPPSTPPFHRLSTLQYCTLFSLRPISPSIICVQPAATTSRCHRGSQLLFVSDVRDTYCPPSALSLPTLSQAASSYLTGFSAGCQPACQWASRSVRLYL